MKWTYEDGGVVKIAKWSGAGDIRCYSLPGWETSADLLDIDPRSGEQLEQSKWFVFARRKP